jgi:protein SCO1/2
MAGGLLNGQTPLGGRDPLLPDEGRVIYRALPDVPVRLVGGSTSSLSAFWRRQPVILVFVFTRCVGICMPLLSSLSETTSIVGGSGEAYQIVVLSFDSRDTPEQLARFARQIGVSPQPGWYFGTVEPHHLSQLVRATGFWYTPIQGSDQYDHPGMIVALRDGRIVRVHVGGTISPTQFRAILRDMRGDLVLSYPMPDSKLVFRCYRYDPRTGQVRWDWGMLALFGPPLLGFPLAILGFQMGRRRRPRSVSDVCPPS